MLKQKKRERQICYGSQPPSGGCVLKLLVVAVALLVAVPAAFGRLCVETSAALSAYSRSLPAAFGRLCVETPVPLRPFRIARQPPSGGCVLKLAEKNSRRFVEATSRLRAAVC